MKLGFDFRTERKEGILLLRLNGEITGDSEEKFKSVLPPEEKAGAVILDFSRVDYINSAGLALLISLVRHCRENGLTISAIHLSDHYRKIVHMIALTDYVTVFDDENAACRVIAAGNHGGNN